MRVKRLHRVTGIVLSCICFIFLSADLSAQTTIVPDAGTRQSLTSVLKDICNWILDIDLRSGELKIEEKRRTSVFINSNFARTLLAGYELTGDQRYLDEALLWFDRLVDLQQPTVASNGDSAGWWGDFSPQGNIYLGDAGTSATALAGAVRFARDARRQSYMKALQRYAAFVRFGCVDDPQNKGRGGSKGWIIQDGEDRGAIGCGYYRGKLSQAPYIIATSVTGAAFFSCLAELTGQSEYMHIAENAMRWLLKVRQPDGEFPYILHGFELDEWPLDTISYVADGIIGVYIRTPDAALRMEINRAAIFTIQWLMNRLNKQGTWGRLRSEDQQRSQGILNLLVWYADGIYADKRLLDTIQANYSYFLDPQKAAAFGVKELPITTGFVGLALAEVLQPGITYRLR